jgi:Carboxypeptidase regulatory-like domain
MNHTLMTKPNLKMKVFLFFILMVSLNSVFAQEPQGSITGFVTDDGGSVSNVTITLKLKTKSGSFYSFIRKTETKSDGSFTFFAIPLGTYKLKVENKCVKSERDNINLEIKIASEDCQQKELAEIAKWKMCEENSSQNNIELTDSDKGEIFRNILFDADEEYKIPDYNGLVNQPNGIIMFSENANEDWLKPISSLGIKMMNLSEIKSLARKKKQDYLVLFFSFKAIGKCVRASAGTSWIIGKKSKRIYLSGGSCTYIFRKESGKWIGKQELCTIS